MLNYAYALLESQVMVAAAEHGLDISIGYLHSQFKRQNALVFDLMEPLRPKVDLAVISSVLDYSFSPKDFLLTMEGVCRLNLQPARRLVELTYDSASLQSATSHVVSNFERFLSNNAPHYNVK
jgi:CRISP-associated protein Cas1